MYFSLSPVIPVICLSRDPPFLFLFLCNSHQDDLLENLECSLSGTDKPRSQSSAAELSAAPPCLLSGLSECRGAGLMTSGGVRAGRGSERGAGWGGGRGQRIIDIGSGGQIGGSGSALRKAAGR